MASQGKRRPEGLSSVGGDDSLHCPHPVSLSLWAMLTRDHRNTLVSPQKTIGEAWLARDTHLCSQPSIQTQTLAFFLDRRGPYPDLEWSIGHQSNGRSDRPWLLPCRAMWPSSARWAKKKARQRPAWRMCKAKTTWSFAASRGELFRSSMD